MAFTVEGIKKARKNSSLTNEEWFEIAKKRYQTQKSLSTIDKDMSALNTELQGVSQGWKSPETILASKTNVQNMINRLNGYRGYLQSTNPEAVSALEKNIKRYSDILSALEETAKQYAEYADEGAYNEAVRAGNFYEKYGNLKTVQEVRDALSSPEFAEKRKSGEITDTEEQYLKNMELALMDSASLEKEIDKIRKEFHDTEFDPDEPLPAYDHNTAVEIAQKRQEASDKIKLIKTLISQAKVREELATKWGEFADAASKSEQLDFDATVKKDIEAITKDAYGEFDPDEKLSPYDHTKAVSVGQNRQVLQDALNSSSLMEDEEKRLFYWLFKNKGADVARNYFQDIEKAYFDERKNQKIANEAKGFSEQNAGTGVLGFLGARVANLASGAEWVANRIGELGEGIVSGDFSNFGKTRTKLSAAAQGLDKGITSKWEDSKTSHLWDLLYGVGAATVESLAAGGIGKATKVPWIGEATLGASAAASTANDLLDRGVSGGGAVLGSVFAGVAESLFEHITIGNIDEIAGKGAKEILNEFGRSRKGIQKLATNIFKNGFVNATEEEATEIANIVTDRIVAGDLSRYATMIADYYKSGETLEDAKKLTQKQLAQDLFDAAASGFLMGGGISTVGTVSSAISNAVQNKKVGHTLKNTNLGNLVTLAEATGDENLIKDAQQLTDNSKPATVGSVLRRTYQHYAERSAYQLTEALKATGLSQKEADFGARTILDTAFDRTSKDSNIKSASLLIDERFGETFRKFIAGDYGFKNLAAVGKILSSADMGNVIKSISVDNTPDATPQQRIDNLRKLISTKAKLADLDASTESGQKQIKAVGEHFGVKVEFKDLDEIRINKKTGKKYLFSPEGSYDKDTNTITINTNRKDNHRPFEYILKHELSHRLEVDTHAFTLFAHDVMATQAFTDYYKSKQDPITGEYYKSESEWMQAIIDRYQSVDELQGSGVDVQYKAQCEMVANFVGDCLFGDTSSITEQLLAELPTKSRNGFVNFVKAFFAKLKKAFSKSVKLTEIQRLEQRFLETAAVVAESRTAENKKTTLEGGNSEKYSLNIKYTDGTIKKLPDARNLTKEDILKFLDYAKSGKLKWNTYIPIRKDTPQIIIDTLNEAGESVENLSLVMQVRKAQQVMSTKNKGNKTVKHGNNRRGHALTAEDIVEITNNLDNPNTIILQTNRYNTNGQPLPNNIVVFVEYNNNENESVAIIEFESSIDPEFIEADVGDTDYHTVVTLFEPDTERNGVPFDYVEELLSNPDNFELEIVRRQPIKSAIGKKHPNTSKELPSNNKITQNNPVVNNYSMPETKKYSGAKQKSAQSNIQYSYAGENAKTADELQLAAAKRMLRQGADSETIRQETGWFKGMDGKWRFEISDDSIELITDSHYIQNAAEFSRLFAKIFEYGMATNEEINRYNELFYSDPDFECGITLDRYIQHPALLEAYPELKKVYVAFYEMPQEDNKIRLGYYDRDGDQLVLNPVLLRQDLEDVIKDVVIHELQHVIQRIEGFARGSSSVYWQRRIDAGEVFKDSSGKVLTAKDLYERTAGEIEGDDTIARREMNAEQRRAKRPDIDRTEVVFADEREPAEAHSETIDTFGKTGYTNNRGEADERLRDRYGKKGSDANLGRTTDYDPLKGSAGTRQKEQGRANRGWRVERRQIGDKTYEVISRDSYTPIMRELAENGLMNGYSVFYMESGTEVIETENSQIIPVGFVTAQPAYTYNEGVASFTEQRLSSLIEEYGTKEPGFEGYSRGYVAYITPEEFLGLTGTQAIIDRVKAESDRLDTEELRRQEETPFLVYVTQNGQVVDHEGRHRMAALRADGIQHVAIVVLPEDGKLAERKIEDIQLVGQHFQSGRARGVVNLINAMPLSEKYRPAVEVEYTHNQDADVRYSMPEVDTYTESQYNDFGWVAANKILSGKELKQLYSKFADIKLLKHKYPKTPDNEYIITTGEKYGNVDSIVFIKGSNKHPIVTKIYRFIAFNTENREIVANEVVDYEQRGYDNANEIIEAYAGCPVFGRYTLQDCISYNEYKRKRYKQTGDGNSEKIEDGARSPNQNTTTDEAGLKNRLAFSLPEEDLLTQYENGEISRQEYLERLHERKTLTPYDIAHLKPEDASWTPAISEPRRTGDGDKQSSFYESALGSRIITDKVKTEIENDTFIKNYQGTTNKRTLKMAVEELEEGGSDRVNKFLDLKGENAVKASPVDVAVGIILLENYQRTGNLDGALRIAEVLREIGTVGGQTVQMFSIISRFTPEMMVVYAQKELDKAFELMAEKQSQKWIDENKDRFQLTDEEAAIIHRNTILASQLEDGTRNKSIYLGEICAILQDKLPPQKGNAIRALQRITLLFNLKTNVRNFLGNANMAGVFVASDFFGNLIDKHIAKKTNVRTTGNFQLKGAGKAFAKGLYESYDDFKRGIRTKQEELNRYSTNTGGGKSFNEQHNKALAKQLNEIAKFLNTMDNVTSLCLEFGDRSFFEMWFNNELNNQMRLNNVDIPTVEMMEIAKQTALQRTWQDDNALTRSMSAIKMNLNKAIHIPGTNYGFGDFVLKFVKTPANIAKAMVEFSPFGFFKAGSNARQFHRALEKGSFTPQMQKEMVRSMSNAITGTLIYALVYVLAASGALKLSGAGDEDKDVSNFEKYVVGIPPYSMEIFGTNVGYSWNQPIGTVLATIADYMDGKESGVKLPWYEDIWNGFKAGMTVFSEQSFLSGIYELFSAEDLATGVLSSIMSEPAAFVPQPFSQIASFTDPYRRTAYESGEAWKSALNNVMLKIPGLRQTLPAQINVLGEKSKNVQYLNLWHTFVNPSIVYPKSSGNVAEEIYELYKATNNNSVIPQVAPYKITVKGQTINFSAEKRAEFQREMGQSSVDVLQEMFTLPEYKKLTDEEKAEAVKDVYSYSLAKTKSQQEYEYQTLAEMVGKTSNGKYILSQERYNKLTDKSKQQIVDEYFFNKEIRKTNGDAEKLAKLFVKKAKE